MTVTVLTGGEILDRGGRHRGDVAVDDESGLIVAVSRSETEHAVAADRTLDASGAVICPGFVDLDVHLRQPGFEAAGTVESGSRAAVLGGYTAVVAAADTDPCPDDAPVVAELRALAKSALCEVVPSGALTLGRAGTAMARHHALIDTGVRFFADVDPAADEPRVVRNALDYLTSIGSAAGARAVVGLRPRHRLAAGAVMHEGEWSARLGLPGAPAEAECLAVDEALALARLTGAAVHLQQITTAGAVERIRRAKGDGLPVTAEVSPHHLSLTDADVAGFDPRYRIDPPLRPRPDVEALRAAVRDGTVDAVATDHHPHTVDAKERPFDQAPHGVLGLETALGVLLGPAGFDLDEVLGALTWRPAAIAGVDDRHGGPVAEGRPANLTVVDPDLVWTPDSGDFGGHATNSPHLGRPLRGRVRHTVVGGEPAVIDGAAVR